MANSKKPRSSNPRGAVKKSLAKTGRQAGAKAEHLESYSASFLSQVVRPGQTLLAAFSGGLDSRVLLEVLAALRGQLGFNLRAMHIHHGLSPNADAWSRFCRETCDALGVPLETVHIDIAKNNGLGIEAAARKARYQALLNNTADYVVLGHHQDDQAETMLLQLLRGAGAKGLSAMANHDAQRRLLRPLLDIARSDILDYAQQHGLQWIEDESNLDTGYDRNYYRHEVLPVLERRFPAAKQTLARAAAHIAEAAGLLDELAEIDAKLYVSGCQLDIAGLANISEARARNLLRWWLSSQQQVLPSTLRLQEMLRQLLSAKPDAGIRLAVNSGGGVWLRRYQGMAYLTTELPSVPIALCWQGESELQLPDGSRLVFERTTGRGLAVERLGINKLRISQRNGGERFKPEMAKPTRTLKHLLQDANIPPWQRERLPLIYCDDMLAVVPGIGVACTLQASPHEAGLVIEWLPA